MKHLTTRMLAIIVALLASLSMMLAIVSASSGIRRRRG